MKKDDQAQFSPGDRRVAMRMRGEKLKKREKEGVRQRSSRHDITDDVVFEASETSGALDGGHLMGTLWLRHCGLESTRHESRSLALQEEPSCQDR